MGKVSPLTGDRLTDFEAELFADDFTSTPTAPYRDNCYICRDPDFAQMGLPLCKPCPKCEGHIPADDVICDDCGYDLYEEYNEETMD